YGLSTATNRNVTWGSETITFENDVYTLGHSGDGEKVFTAPGQTSVTVSGDTVRPVMFVEGSGSNVTISWGGRTLTLPNFTNTKWIIDFKEYTVLRNGALALGDVGGRWMDMVLVKGQSDVIVTGTNLNMEISFE